MKQGPVPLLMLEVVELSSTILKVRFLNLGSLKNNKINKINK